MTTKNKNQIKTKTFKYSLLVTAMMGMTSMPLMAQEAQVPENEQEEAVETIEIKGTRGALINAQNMRREADTLLDALSATDIGALPDRSVLEAISRVPGVTIGRFAAPNDPDHFGTEGSGLVVRGLTQVRSEFNGRDTFTANSGRSLSFEDIPPELIGGVEVFKNQTADMIEGGIAGTVNLITKKPFDNGGGRKISMALDMTHADFIDETTPTFFALYSDTFESDAGRFGWLINASKSELKAQSDGIQVGQLDAHEAFDNQLVPRSMRITRKKDDREREGYAAVLQYESTDGSLQATAEFIRSESSLAWTESAVEWADDDYNRATKPALGTEYEFGDDGVFQNGYITTDAGWRGADGLRQPGGQYGGVHPLVSRARQDESIVEDFSLNVVYTPNDTWAFNFDLQHVRADTQIQDFQLQGATYLVSGIDLTQGSIPRIELRNPNFATGTDSPSENYFTDPQWSFHRAAMDHVSDNDGEQDSIRFDAKYTLDNGFFTSISSGVRYADREQTSRESTYNWGNLSVPWSGDTSTMFWFDDERSDLATEIVSFENFGRGGLLDIEGGNNIRMPALSLAQNYRDSIPSILDISGGWRPLGQRDNVIPGTDFLPQEINETAETSTALYTKANFEGELSNGIFYSGNVGLRYVKIENDTSGSINFPDNTIDGPNDLDAILVADQQAFGNRAAVEQVAANEYTNVMPSFNVKLDINDDFLIRIGISEAIALPQLGLLRNSVSIRGDELIREFSDTEVDSEGNPEAISAQYSRYVADAGNPFLKPMEAWNYDLTFEWYFAEDGNLNASLFYKDIKNYFITGSTDRVFTNNGSTQTVQVNGATNGEKGKIQGFEISYQQYYKELPDFFDGIGTQFNYTYVDDEGSPNSNLSPDQPGSPATSGGEFEGLPLEGLSRHTFNATLLYQNHGVDARLAYNWRSEYLLTSRDVITQLPIFSEEAGFLDSSIFYDVTENFQVGVQMSNLLNTESVTRMQYNQEGDQITRGVFVNDRRFSFVVRGNF
jgi:TonB-dependent receptor